MKWNRNHRVHIRIYFRSRHLPRQHGREIPSRTQVRMIFQPTRNVLVAGTIEEQRRGIGIWPIRLVSTICRLVSLSNQQGIEPVGHLIARHKGKTDPRKVGEAGNADMFLVEIQASTANHTSPRQDDIHKRRSVIGKRKRVFHSDANIHILAKMIIFDGVMKRLLFFIIAGLLFPAICPAQEIRYPEEVRGIFEKADAATPSTPSAPSTSSGTETVGEHGRTTETGGDAGTLMPRIAVPDCPEKEHLVEMVLLAGCSPVVIPSMDNIENPYSEIRDLAAAWDGALMPDGWVNRNNDYSILFYKAVADRNIPFIGTSKLTKAIDSGLRRMPTEINSMEELACKARTYRKAKEIMDGILTVDTHCDLPENYSSGASVGIRSRKQCSVQKMDEGHLDSQVLISFLWQGPLDEASMKSAAEKNFKQIREIKEDIEKYPEACGQATNQEEAEALRRQGKKAFFIGVENAYGIGNDLGNIKKLRDLGVIYITLCHFRDNAVCNTSSRHGSNPAKGLTDFGRAVVEEMNKQGLMIDLSHPSSGTFWDCIKYSKAPIICSHSGAKAIYGHDRGLDDRQLKALAENGGVIQVYTVPEFLTRNQSKSSIDDMMAHFNHCVEVAGPEHVGIGSDFDGGGTIIGCNGDNDMINITVKMLEHGYTPAQIEGFWGGNFLRVMKEVQAIGDRD